MALQTWLRLTIWVIDMHSVSMLSSASEKIFAFCYAETLALT